MSLVHHQLLECDYTGKEYTDSVHDITVIIPQGVVATKEKFHFEVAIALCGPFNLPKNTQLISPIFWLYPLEESVEIKKPVKVIIPHCLKGHCQYYQIKLANVQHNISTVTVSGQKLFNFKLVDGTIDLTSKEYHGFGVVETMHFGFLCILAEKQPQFSIVNDIKYCLVRVELCISESCHEVLFCGIYCLPTCLQVYV